jgi:uncharacterized protein YceK
MCAGGLCGCGTTSNLNSTDGKPAIFGGVRRDLEMQLVADYCENSEPGGLTLLATVPLMVLSLVDLPLSAVCDTLTLPLTIRLALEKDSGPAQPAPKTTPAGAAPSSSTPPAPKQ